jgi:catechol-2,3-dioxygenase
MAVRLTRIGHVNLTVWDVERSRDFYSRVLGFEVVEQDPMHRTGQGVHMALPGDGHTLDIGPVTDRENAGSPPRRRERIGVMHFAFKVGSYEDLQEAYHTLIANGVEIDRMTDHVTQRSIYFQDPDGNNLEIYYEYPTAKMITAMGRGDRDFDFSIDDPLPEWATFAGATASVGAWRQGQT